MKTTDYVDELRVKLDARSDFALSKLLGIAHNQIGRYRKGGTFDNTMALRVAELLDVSPLTVIADMELERAKDAKARDTWATFLSKAASIACAATIGIGAGTAPAPSNASDLTAYKFPSINA